MFKFSKFEISYVKLYTQILIKKATNKKFKVIEYLIITNFRSHSIRKFGRGIFREIKIAQFCGMSVLKGNLILLKLFILVPMKN